MNEEIIFKPIGVIHSTYTDVNNMPKRPQQSGDTEASIEIDYKYIEAISDIKAGEKYMLIFYFHKSKGYELTVPLLGIGPMKGLFSTHAPRRPNAIGVSVITIKQVVDNVIYFTGVDMLDGTPVLDIKNAV